MLFVTAVALAHCEAIELERPVEAHARIIDELLLDKVELSEALVAVLRNAREQAHFVFVGPSDFFKLGIHLQIGLQNLLSHLQAHTLVGLGQLLLLLSTNAEQVLINQRQCVAFKIDGLLDLRDLLIDLTHIDLHAEQTLNNIWDLLEAKHRCDGAHL